MLYNIIRGFARFLLFFMGLKKDNTDRLPSEGPVIVAANHVSNWDPVIVAVALKRPIHFMAKVELFNNKLLGKLLTRLYVFPVIRGTADRKAIRHALDILANGQVLGIFPEGARKKVQPDSQVHTGVAMLALKSGAQVVPAACIGTEKNFPIGWFKPFKVKLGSPVNLDQYRNQKINSALLTEVSEHIMREINRLLDK